MKINYNQTLTRVQFHVVQHGDGPGLILAGPGSGKTYTMIYRVAYLIEKGVRPENILLLTFTRKAAKEMLSRIYGLIGDSAEKVNGGTFHSFAVRNLFKHAQQLGYSGSLTILGQGDSSELIGSLRKQIKKAKFPISSKIQRVISRATNMQINLVDILPQYPEFDEYREIILEIAFQYQQEKRRMNFLDYDDILIEFRRLLQIYPHVKRMYGQKYRYIMIDEYQDTNIIQADIARMLSEELRNLVVVGDDCQSIYAFRGATIQNILTFVDQFPDANVYHLTENFRSHPPIIDVANTLIQKAEEKFEKTLTAVSQDTSIQPQIKSFLSRREQAEWITEQIVEYYESGIPYHEIAVLYRNTYHSNLLDMFLTSSHIPYVKVGGIKLIESAHIKDILSFLRIQMNPKDRLSWIRVLRMIPGVGQVTADDVFEILEAQYVLDGIDMNESLRLLPGKGKISSSLRALGEFLCSLDTTQPISDSLMTIWEYYLPIFKKKFNKGEHEYRRFGVENLLEFAQRYMSLDEFLAEFLLSEEEENGKSLQKDNVTLTTIHSAKGLEWQVVFVIGVNEGSLPSYRSEDIEEELRLLYVAVTRAKHHLAVTYPKNIVRNGRAERVEPSRFLTGLLCTGIKE